MRRPPAPRILLYALTVTLLVALGVAAVTSTVAFSPYNPAWDGTSDIRHLADEQADRTIALDTSPYTSHQPNETVAIVIGPDEPYQDRDADRVASFVHNGGTLVVLDNVDAAGNEILTGVGAQARFDGDLLRDEQSHYRGPALPIAPNVTDHPYTVGVDQLTLNYGTVIEPGNATVLVKSSPVSYVDRAGTGEVADADTLQAYPVLTIESVGDGQVIAISDPSLFINEMLAQPDNTQLAANLFSHHTYTIIDVSRSDSPPLAVIALIRLQQQPVWQGLLGLGALLLVWRVHPRRTRFTSLSTKIATRYPRVGFWLGLEDKSDTEPPLHSDSEAVRAYLQTRHPDWEPKTIDRIIAGTIRSTDRDRDDE